MDVLPLELDDEWWLKFFQWISMLAIVITFIAAYCTTVFSDRVTKRMQREIATSNEMAAKSNEVAATANERAEELKDEEFDRLRNAVKRLHDDLAVLTPAQCFMGILGRPVGYLSPEVQESRKKTLEWVFEVNPDAPSSGNNSLPLIGWMSKQSLPQIRRRMV